MRERLGTRSTALLVVALVHVGLLGTLTFSNFSRRGAATSERTLTVTYFDESQPPTPGPSRETQHHRPQASRRRVPVETAPIQSPPPENAITAAPIDWSDEARRASEAALAHQEKDRALRSFDFPKGMGPPLARRGEHVYGDIEHFDGGESIMWINSRC
ncbi:MAG TPA: hypothetical protein VI653_27330, partial [Steroidobacteraceae bacterium]